MGYFSQLPRCEKHTMYYDGFDRCPLCYPEEMDKWNKERLKKKNEYFNRSS
jgi:hypothetical protein